MRLEIATKIECSEHIPFYAPAQVFEVGTLVDVLPKVKGFTIAPEAERFAEGVIVHVGLVVARHSFQIEAAVTEFEPSEHVMIKGGSHVGKAEVWLDLAANKKQGGTDICYGVLINHSISTKLAERPVARHLRHSLPEYAAGYRQNVIDRLDQLEGKSHRPSGRKKAA